MPSGDGDAAQGGVARSTLLICTRCNWTGSEAERAGARSGKALLDLVTDLADAGTNVQGVACVSGCKRACAIGVVAPGKVTYLFGDLPPTSAAAAEIVAFGRQHAASADGWVRRAQRPALLREGILARLPPPQWEADDEIRWPS